MAIRCNSDAEAVIRTSWSKANPGKLYYACTIKGPKCNWIGWVNDQKCDCKHLRMKIEAENRNLKLLLFISWIFFLSVIVYKL
ncbi:hypothetical protein LXL04_038325 [Taraxacum kok-saghyz]